MSQFLKPSILLLREGTDESQGKAQIISNINACESIVETVKSTLGPRGMDKMITQGTTTTITNDGATVLNLLEIDHPAAKTLVDIAKSQDNEVGDGTTTVTILAGEFLKEGKKFIDAGMHSQNIIQGFQLALKIGLEKLEELCIKVDQSDKKAKREMLIKCAETALNSKLLFHYKKQFAELVVSAVEKLDTKVLDKELIGIKTVTGGSISDSFIVDGVAFKKTFSYAGFEQQPKKFVNPKICLLNLELELKSEKENAEIKIEKPEDYQSIVDAEWKIIYDKLDTIVKSGAQVILSKLPIGDLATQYFADRGLFCAGRVPKEDMVRVAEATDGIIQTTTNGLSSEALGTCGLFEEVQIGAERYNLFKECPKSKTATLIIRGSAEQFIAECERSINDAIMIVRRAIKTNSIVAGGGAIELELSKYLRQYSREISGKIQLVINSFAKALEIIPKVIADNAGLDSVEVLNKLRQKHALDDDGKYFGVSIYNQSGIGNSYQAYVWEPTLIKRSALIAATNAACTILSIDTTIKNPEAEEKRQQRMQQRMPTGCMAIPPGAGGKSLPPGIKQNMQFK